MTPLLNFPDTTRQLLQIFFLNHPRTTLLLSYDINPSTADFKFEPVVRLSNWQVSVHCDGGESVPASVLPVGSTLYVQLHAVLNQWEAQSVRGEFEMDSFYRLFPDGAAFGQSRVHDPRNRTSYVWKTS